ncbi:MAG: hypothetical protein FD180_1748 [Planctomycetota bacterium]|nr:MAG: hypothetical protein FD180_1748 [Planctomycetota bacterium]
MRSPMLFTIPLVALLTLVAPGHTGMPPSLPELNEIAPETIAASATNCDISGTSWCSYPVSALLRCKKNGTYVGLTFNSVTSDWPHSYHLDKTWNVNLVPLTLQSGDTLVWEFCSTPLAGPNMGQTVTTSRTTQVQ